MRIDVTLTGLDARTPMLETQRLLRDYPRLELALLYTATPEGRNRYLDPCEIDQGLRALRMYADHYGTRPGALHVCGRSGRERLHSGDLDSLIQLAGRVQINGPVARIDLERLCERYPARGFITQNHHHAGCTAPNHAILMDGSGGRGRVPRAWMIPKVKKKRIGAAGGLRPSNLKVQLESIGEAAMASGVTVSWIDAETGVRDSGDWFDLDLARRFCEAVWGRPVFCGGEIDD